jgi:hypothetical protein
MRLARASIACLSLAVFGTSCGSEHQAGKPSRTREDHARVARSAGTTQPASGGRYRKACEGSGRLADPNTISRPIGFSPAVFILRNAWLGTRGRRFVNVYAGALRKAPQRAAVFLLEVPITNGAPMGPSGYYSASRTDGPARITCIRGDVIYFRSRRVRYAFRLQNPGLKVIP